MSEEGYLVCESCKGYYKLQKGEKASDFDLCECGGSLIFQNDLNIIPDQEVSEDDSYKKDPIHSNKEKRKKNSSKTTKNKAEKRKELFEELTKEVHVHEDLLNIKDGKISSEEVTGNLRDADNQMMVSNILTNESIISNNKETSSNIKADENKLISQIHDKRTSVRESNTENSLNGSNFKIIMVLIIIIALIGVFFLFFK
ncbi:hypothetical protein [Methanobacterium alcaliphilum]|uniref:hypothetical protein n=1 Tax=Methanobacterium alcaliphilum TaxID=392018 RepID=UPI00200A137E|nr:hypothetical protein [Methanobacterium alcaliphilum]MCK9152383.1 hypothetical protein [Methanobacterium alcaliphilum]